MYVKASIVVCTNTHTPAVEDTAEPDVEGDELVRVDADVGSLEAAIAGKHREHETTGGIDGRKGVLPDAFDRRLVRHRGLFVDEHDHCAGSAPPASLTVPLTPP